MPAYALRVDTALEAVLAWLALLSVGGFGVREVSGVNEHWHFLLETDKTIKQLRCSFNRKVPELKGNKSYSLTECRDVEKYERYMCKGESDGEMPEVAWRNSMKYDDDKLKALHDDYWINNRALKRKRGGSMIDWVIDECKAKNVEWTNRRKISEIYIRELGSRGKPINLHAVRSNVNAVQFALCPDDGCLVSLVDRVEQWQ